MAKYKSFGIQFQHFNGTIWVDIGQVLRIGDFGWDKGILDATTHDSTGGYREKLSHLIEQPSFDVVIVWDPASAYHPTMLSYANNVNLAPTEFRIQFPDSGSTTWALICIVRGFTVNAAEVDGLLQATITFEPTGAPNFSP